MKKLFLLSLVFMLFFSGTNKTSRTAYKPIYISKAEAKVVSFGAAQEVKIQGKIYIKGDYIFIGDVNLGVHIIDNSVPETPVKIGFLKIYGNHDISIKGDILFADNFEDMIAIDISNIQQPVITKRIEKVYKLKDNLYPPNVPYRTYFECVDSQKGYVIDWEIVEGVEANCYTNN